MTRIRTAAVAAPPMIQGIRLRGALGMRHNGRGGGAVATGDAAVMTEARTPARALCRSGRTACLASWRRSWSKNGPLGTSALQVGQTDIGDRV